MAARHEDIPFNPAVELTAYINPEQQGLLGDMPAPVDKAQLGAGRFCPNPFEYAQIDPDGSMFLCCPAMLFRKTGNLAQQDFLDAWNSAEAQAIRASILDGSFRYCSAETCGLLRNGLLPKVAELENPEHQRMVAEQQTILEHGPRTINFSYDQSCNLACPSCRSKKIVLKGEERDFAGRIHDKVTGAHLADARRLHITGSGDPFVGRYFLDFLQSFEPKEYPEIRIQLSTNGLLLTPKMWDSICHEAIDWIDVSIDGASAETYGKNRGGNFGKLVENLRFIGELRQSGAIQAYNLHYVVQQNNYHEMPDFVRLGLAVHCDGVLFKQVQNWGSWSPEEYAARAIQHPAHPEHLEFLEALQDPMLQHPIVRMHDLYFWSVWQRYLGLNPGEAQRVLAIVNELKDQFAALCSRHPQGGGPSPAAFMAEATARMGEEGGALHEAFLAYAGTHQPEGERDSYLALLAVLDDAAKGRVRALLSAAQRKHFDATPLESLLNVATGHDPLGAQIAALIAEQGAAQPVLPEASPLREMLGLEEYPARLLEELLVQGKEAMARAAAAATASGRPTPLETLATGLVRRDAEASATFLRCAATERMAETGETYAAHFARIEEVLAMRLRKALPEQACARLARQAKGRFLQLPTHTDPLGDAVRAKIRARAMTNDS